MATHQLTPGRKRIEVAGDVEERARSLFAAEWNARQEAWRREAAADLIAALDLAVRHDRPRLANWLAGKRARAAVSAPSVRLIVEAFGRFVGSPDSDQPMSAHHLGKLRAVHSLRLAEVPYREIAARVPMTEDYAKQLEREWQKVFGPAPEGWRDQVTVQGVAPSEGELEIERRWKPAAGMPERRPAIDQGPPPRRGKSVAGYDAASAAAKKRGEPFRPVDQRATTKGKGGPKTTR